MGQIIQRFDFEGQRGALALPSVLSDAFSPHTFTLQSSLDKGAFFSSAKLGQGALSLFNIPTRTEASCDATDSCFIVFINSGDAESVASRAWEWDVEYPLVVSEGKEISEAYDSRMVPSTFLIDKQGQLIKQFVGFKDKATLDRAFGELVGS